MNWCEKEYKRNKDLDLIKETHPVLSIPWNGIDNPPLSRGESLVLIYLIKTFF